MGEKLGTACYVKGAAAVLSAVEQKLGVAPGAITPDGKLTRIAGLISLLLL